MKGRCFANVSCLEKREIEAGDGVGVRFDQIQRLSRLDFQRFSQWKQFQAQFQMSDI
jgi:hypothetical protein